MGRKDISEKRRNQILDAFEHCVIKYGLPKTTIKKIAERSQVNKGIIYHYIGNKKDLSKAWIERLADEKKDDFRVYLKEQKSDISLQTFVEYHFDEWARYGHTDNVMIDALIAYSSQDPSIKNLLFETFFFWVNMFAEELLQLYPKTTMEQRQLISYAIWSMGIGSSIMITLGFDPKLIPEVRSLAITLIKTLEGDS